MKNKEADTELESRLLEILVHPCRIEDIRRELPNAGKNNLKNALDALVADGRVMKNKKNRFAVSAHYGCAAGTYLATERAFALSRRIIRRAKPSRMICSSRRMRPAVRGTATACSSR